MKSKEDYLYEYGFTTTNGRLVTSKDYEELEDDYNSLNDLESISKLQRLKSVSRLIKELESEKTYLESYLEGSNFTSIIRYPCPINRDKLESIDEDTLYCSECDKNICRVSETDIDKSSDLKCGFEEKDGDFAVGMF